MTQTSSTTKTSPAIAALLKQVKPAQASIRLCLRGDLLGQLDLIRDDLGRHDGWTPDALSDTDPRVELRADLAALEQEMRDATAVFTFQSIGDKAWSDLLAAHPAREGQEESFDPATFPVALIAASGMDPVMTEDDVRELFDVFTLQQRNALFSAAYSANIRGVDIPFLSASFDVEAVTARK